MSAENLNQILKNPSQLHLSHVSILNEVIEKYPYFQAPKAVQLKSLKEQNSYLYNQKLKETAAYTVDRGVLFEFITSKAFLEKNNSTTEEEISKKTLIAESEETPVSNKESAQTNIEDLHISIPKTEGIKMTNTEADQIVDPFLFEEKTNTPHIEPPKENLNLEETLKPNAPLNFQKEETHSFTEWLKLASLKPIVREEKEKIIPKKKMIESSLIDNFIKNNPKISPVKKDTPAVNLAKQNMLSTDDLMTETLAKVYIAQKNYKKAIQAYKILSLKNPEKSGLFADQIRAIEKLQNNKQ